MSTPELAKTYEPATVEAEAYRVWLEEKCFVADPSRDGAPYSIVIPPPNVTGALHLGHAINNTLQDILTRMHRMAGFNAVWIPGLDHAGIATQAVVEKQLKEKENLTRHDVGREGLVARIWEWKQQYGDRILAQLQRLGCSCDWSRTRFTLDEQCATAVRHTFFKLFKDGLVYRGKRLVNWDIHLQTSISDDEIYHETVKTSMWHIRYPIVGGDLPEGEGTRPTHMTVATTRPETMLGDTAVAVHSQDPRWNWAIGKFVELPLTGRKIPIIADDILVDPKFGSGVVKVTPAHDPNDYAVHQRHLGKPDAIEIINILNPDGTINSNGGAYSGMKRDAARKKIVAELEVQGLLAKEEPYETQVGHSDRSKTAVEPYLSDQWFVKMAPLAEPALEVVRDGTIKFFPERHAQQYLSWLGEKRDWPISRQLWWGHRIPVWHKRLNLDVSNWTQLLEWGLDSIVNQWKDTSVSIIRLSTGELIPAKQLMPVAYAEEGDYDIYICSTDDSAMETLVQAGFVQDPDVLDTWFSSALWPHSTLGWPQSTPDLAKWYPTSVLLTGRDIITLWVARMVMLGMYNMGTQKVIGDWSVTGSPSSRTNHQSPAPSPLPATALGIPFAHVAINPTILDGKGERMSKSKGNGVDPVEIIDIYGADALRFTLTSMATETQDARMPVKKDAQGRNTSDKFDIGRNFCNKLWNAARFVLGNLKSAKENAAAGSGPLPVASHSLVDRWIVSRFNRAVTEANAALATYRFDQYARACYDFFWRDFCDWYVEAIKPVMKDSARSAQTSDVLAAMLDGALRLMHPMIPFITETIWWRLNDVRPTRTLPGAADEHPPATSRRLILAPWPGAGPIDELAEASFARLQAMIVAIRNVRNQYKVDVRKPVTVHLSAPVELTGEIEANRQIVELLATATIGRIGPAAPPPPGAARATAGEVDIFIEGVIDPQAELQRLDKQRDALKQKATALRGRLANPSYTEKAPPHLVRQTRDELAGVEAELLKLGI